MKLVDILVLGTCAEKRTGSSPVEGNKFSSPQLFFLLNFYPPNLELGAVCLKGFKFKQT